MSISAWVSVSGKLIAMLLDRNNWKVLLAQGFELKSSGTTGNSKTVFQSPEKLAAANLVALEAQRICRHSRVLTVCSMEHAGGVLAQTLPALSIGADVVVRPFSAYTFLKDVQGFSHTHLTPTHCLMLMKTRRFAGCDFHGLFITCGSDKVPFEIIEAFVRHGATFMCNWGMTEIGPIVINTIFESVEKVVRYGKKSLHAGSLMGDNYYCDYRIRRGCLYVKGPTCVYESWFNTQDAVQLNAQGAMYHMGRRV